MGERFARASIDLEAGATLVRHLERFGSLSTTQSAAIRHLVNASPIRTVRSRVDLIGEGDKPRVLYVVQSGWAARHKVLVDGRRQIISFLIPGDFCDLHNNLLGRMDHSIGAITRLRVAEVAHDAVEVLMARYPDVAMCLRKQMLVSVSVQREWTLNVGQRSALERLAHLFCEMMLRLRSVDLAHDVGFEFPLTQADLGDALGLTSVHINRTLRQLRDTGMIDLSGRVLTIRRFAELADLAQFNADYLHLGKGADRAPPPARPSLYA